MKSKISEGLKEQSLDHLIIPMLTVDEYESKIDDKRVIVVGFFMFDKDPAEDLASFIDKSSSKVLDTEVSPAPTPDGYYVVFIELLRDNEFPEILLGIVSEVENLCKNLNWQMQCQGCREPIDVTDENIRKNVILDQYKLKDKKEEKSAQPNRKKNNNESAATVSEDLDFWSSCQVDQILLESKSITFIKNASTWTYELCNDIPISSINLFENAHAGQLKLILGPDYNVWQMRDVLVVEHNDIIKVLKY